MEPAAFARSFSMPIGPGGAYAPPPYTYRGVEDIFVAYEAEPDGVKVLLPPGLEPVDEIPVCIAWARWVPFSTFGAYHEAYVMIRASFEGQTYLYQPFIFTDNEIPLVAGREIWGYAKKLATMERTSGGGGTPFGEQMLFTVERPRGQRIMTVAIVCDALADPNELEDVPVLSTRVIPNAEPGPPSVAQLVRLDVVAPIHTSADGTPKLWTGRASVTMDARSPVDPWHLLAPTRILQGWFGIYDFDLGHGRVIHDYLKDTEIWRGE
ncbi:MAG: acetoacetate decarboxylase [Solirubrobacteraceae bacterium]|jgi:acetoacetate decarboxylase|nr:acetoacetate decarboxylase [Solirubrobacteraceae bacterium]